jgi:hypothetical protein
MFAIGITASASATSGAGGNTVTHNSVPVTFEAVAVTYTG